MKIKTILISAYLSVFIISCKAPVVLTQVKSTVNTNITSAQQEDPEFTKLIDPYKKEMDKRMNTKISHTNIELTKVENLGNLLADFMFEGASDWGKQNGIATVDGAIINKGGIRSSIGKGDILLKNIFEVMPFENEVVIVKMKGADMHYIFEYYAKTQKSNPVSHFYIETDKGQVVKGLINNQTVNIDKDYYIATSDYLALGGDNMSFFGKGQVFQTGLKMRDLFIQKFHDMPEVKISTDTRLVFNGKKDGNE